MARKPRVFLDSSTLISAIMSRSESSAARQLLRLGEAEAIALSISHEVLRDMEYIVGRRRPDMKPNVAYLIYRSNISTALDPAEETVKECLDLTGYLPDARVLAAAVECDADIFVSRDMEHFVANPLIGPPRTRLIVQDEYHAVEWCRDRLLASGEQDLPDEPDNHDI